MKKISFQRPAPVTKSLRLACVAISLAFLSSCSVVLPVSTSGKVGGAKVGTATATSIFGFWIDQDASIKTAAANGGIKTISTVDLKTTTYFWVFRTCQTIVTGD